MSKAGAPWQPQNPVEISIRNGDVENVLDLLDEMTESERFRFGPRLVKAYGSLRKLSFGLADPERSAWWGGVYTKEQEAAFEAALLLCAPAKDQAYWLDSAEILRIAKRFKPALLDELQNENYGGWRIRFEAVQALIINGLISRPQTEAYALDLMQTLGHRKPFYQFLTEDPGLIPGPLLRLFEVEGTSDTNMAGMEKYRGDWGPVFMDFIAKGVYTRELILEKTLGTLERDWPQFRSGWFSRFHKLLNPSPTEMAAFLPRYLGLCNSRIPPTVALALESLDRLYAEKRVGAAELLNALPLVLNSSVKSQVEGALKLLDKIVKSEPALASQAAEAAGHGLMHESPELHKKIITRLRNWTIDAGTRERLREFLPHVAATSRSELATLLGEPETVVEAQQAAEFIAGPGVQDALALSRVLTAIADLDELIDRIAFVFENDHEIDELERVIEALVRMAPFDEAAKRQMSPVLKRARKLKHAITVDIAEFVLNIVEEKSLELPRVQKIDAQGMLIPRRRSDDKYPDYYMNRLAAHELLILRLTDLADFAQHAYGLPPLSAATHQRGFIDPVQLAERLRLYADRGVEPRETDACFALLRLPSGDFPQALTHAKNLKPTPVVMALRYALGDSVVPAVSKPLFATASRIRYPQDDDEQFLAAFPDPGPDVGLAARYRWYVETLYPGEEYEYQRAAVDITPVFTGIEPGCFASYLPNPAADDTNKGAVFYLASLRPGNLDYFHARGAASLSNNLQWGEAAWNNRIFLQALQDPTVPLTPMAVLVLALGLCCKEPGEVATAVDVLTGAWEQGRLDEQLLGTALRDLLYQLLILPARLRKSLDAARRSSLQSAVLVFDLLNLILLGNPEQAPRDISSLLELLLELKTEMQRALHKETAETLAGMKLGGKGKGLIKSLVGDKAY